MTRDANSLFSLGLQASRVFSWKAAYRIRLMSGIWWSKAAPSTGRADFSRPNSRIHLDFGPTEVSPTGNGNGANHQMPHMSPGCCRASELSEARRQGGGARERELVEHQVDDNAR